MSATNRSGLAATVLAVPVLAEIAWPDPFDSTSGQVFFAASQLVGWALLASVVLGAPAAARSASPRARGVVLAGCTLQVVFATVYGATAFDGEPLEASFVAFMLGFVALLVGGLVWATRLRRTAHGRVAATGLLATAVLGALAILVGSDPFHDICLVSSYAAWIVVGRGFDALRNTSADGRGNAAAPIPSPSGRAGSASHRDASRRP